MCAEHQGERLLQHLQRDEPEQQLERWLRQTCERSWRLRLPHDERKRMLVLQLRERCLNVLIQLRQELPHSPRAEVGAPALRETVRAISFTAGWMAGVGLSATDTVALMLGLEDLLGQPGRPLYRGLQQAAHEAFCSSVVQQLRSQHQEIVLKSQLVLRLGDGVPCLLLVADPDRLALDDAVGRLMMLAAMGQRSAVVVDASALLEPARRLPMVLDLLADLRAQRPVRVLISGVAQSLERELNRRDGHPLAFYPELERALAAAGAPA